MLKTDIRITSRFYYLLPKYINITNAGFFSEVTVLILCARNLLKENGCTIFCITFFRKQFKMHHNVHEETTIFRQLFAVKMFSLAIKPPEKISLMLITF